MGALDCSLGLGEGDRVGVAQALMIKLKMHTAIKLLVFKMISLKFFVQPVSSFP